MKQLIATWIMCLLVSLAHAQDVGRPPRKETGRKGRLVRPLNCPRIYLTTSSGINNNTGVAGFSFDIPFDKYLAADLGAGYSSWGYKAYLGGKYYLLPCHRGWAFGTGVTYNTGLTGQQVTAATIGGNETVRLNLHSQSNVLFAAYHYWSLGKRYNRFYGQLGWSVPLSSSNTYDETSGEPLTAAADKTIRRRAPGGLVAAIGFSFGVH